MLYPGTLGAPHVIGFCSEIVSENSPVSVICEPDFSQPENECFVVVEQRTSKLGGEHVFGWAIWESPRVFIEAEFHSVWRSPEGDLIDISPRPYNFPNTTFLPDPNRKYEGRQNDNVRRALVDDRDVVRFLYLASKRHKIMNSGDLANKHGYVSLTKKQSRELKKVVKEATALELKISRKYSAGSSR